MRKVSCILQPNEKSTTLLLIMFFFQVSSAAAKIYVACSSMLGGKSIKQAPVIDNAAAEAGVIASSHENP